MLHASTSETKINAAQGKAHIATKPERELHPPMLGVANPHMLNSVMPKPSSGVQRRQNLAELQSTHGNQAVLLMLRSPQQIARKPTIRPSQSMMVQRTCACGGTLESEGECAECKAKREASLQRRATNSPASPVATNGVPPIVHDVLRSPGQPLDIDTRAFMEPRFGYDFSHVRIHTDSKAAESAQAVNALAYTVGSHVVFGARQHLPETSEGRRLMAHELTHVVQQQRGTLPSLQRLTDDKSEGEVFEWASNRFANINVGEDARFVWGSRAGRITVLKNTNFHVGIIHRENVNQKRTKEGLLAYIPASCHTNSPGK